MSFTGYEKLSALVVDDFKNFRDSLSAMLDRFGVQHVDSAGSGSHALKYCQYKPYDLIFCDYNLGEGRNGVQVMEVLRQKGFLKPDSLLIVITAETNRAVVMATYDCAPDAYLCKPITTNYLKLRLDKLLSMRAELQEIHTAIANERLEEAAATCEAIIEDGGRRSLECRKLLGDIYTRRQEYQKAELLYETVLSERPVAWAQIGLAAVKNDLGEKEHACQILNNVLRENPHQLDAYDLLAKIYYEDGDTEATQMIVEDAVKICPLSVPRRKKLGDVARDNQDYKQAVLAYKECIAMGTHSCFDEADNHIKFGRTAAALFEIDDSEAKKWSLEAVNVLEGVPKRFDTNFDEDMQLMLVQSHIIHELGDADKSEALLTEARRLRESHTGRLNLQTELDLVGALGVHTHQDESDKLLAQLLTAYDGDERSLMQIDRYLDEPLSSVNRKKVARLNSTGVGLYNKKSYKESIDCFIKAKQMFPRHMGIMLNLVQALNAQMDLFGVTNAYAELSAGTLRRVERRVNAEDDVYVRYRHLRDQLTRIIKN